MAAKTKPQQKQEPEILDENAEAEALLASGRAHDAKIAADALAWSSPRRGGAKVTQARFVEAIFIPDLGEYLKTLRSGETDVRHRRRYAMELVGPLLWIRVKHGEKETTSVVPVTNLIDLQIEDAR